MVERKPGNPIKNRILALMLDFARGYISGRNKKHSPSVTTLFETPITSETRGETKRFSAEQRKALEEQGYRIYILTGRQSVETLKDSDLKLFKWSYESNSLPAIRNVDLIHSEVAINPNNLFLPESNNKTGAQREEMVEEFSQELGEQIKGVKAVIGNDADYLALAFQHKKATAEILFGGEYRHGYGGTRTKNRHSDIGCIGGVDAGDNSIMLIWRADIGHKDVYAVRLVVPV